MTPTAIVQVALVDDDPHYRQMFGDAVRMHPQLVLAHAASSGREMLDWLQDHRPDVLLVDLGLPDIPGLEIIEFGAQRWPQLSMAVVTLFSDEPHVMACLEAGAMGYILKQSAAMDVAPMILEIHQGGSPMSPSIARYVLQRLRRPQHVDQDKPLPLKCDAALSEREILILNYIGRGFRVAEVAKLLGIQDGTVSSHLKNIYGKLSVHSKTEAVFEASRMGLIDGLFKH